MDELSALRQKGTADEYVNQFKMLAARAGITDHEALIRYFLKGLQSKLANKMLDQMTYPESIYG